jgi:hypothetical protein
MCLPALGPLLIGSLAPTAAVGSAAGVAGGLAGTLGTILQVGGGVVGAVSQAMNARAASTAARRTAAAQQQAARDALEQGEQESDQRRRAGALLQGQNQVAMAANGMDVTAAHSLDILDDTQGNVEQDAFRIRSNAQRQAQQFSQGAANSMAEAASYRSQALFQPLQTVLSTGARVGERYASWVAADRYPSVPNPGAYT